MLDEEILELRRKLDESITNKVNYEEIYNISIKLDKLISKHYDKKMKNNVANHVGKNNKK